MFESLQDRLGSILNGLTGRGALSEKDVSAALREVRRALIEADVALEVVRSNLPTRCAKRRSAPKWSEIGHAGPDGGQDRPRRTGRDARRSEGVASRSQLAATAPVVVMMVGLQGSGKTTTTGKIAKRLTEKREEKGADGVARCAPPRSPGTVAPAWRADRSIDTLPIVAGQSPTADRRARRAGRQAWRLMTSSFSTRPAAPISTSR